MKRLYFAIFFISLMTASEKSSSVTRFSDLTSTQKKRVHERLKRFEDRKELIKSGKFSLSDIISQKEYNQLRRSLFSEDRSKDIMPSPRFDESSENDSQTPKLRPKRVKRTKNTTNPSRVSKPNPSIDPRIDRRLFQIDPDSRRAFDESLKAKDRELRKQRLSRRHGSDDLLGRWKEDDYTETYTLTVGSNQSIPNPLHAIGYEPSEGSISVKGGDLNREIKYLSGYNYASSYTQWFDTLDDIEWPAIGLWFYYNEDMPYVFHPDTVGLDIFERVDDTTVVWLGDIILDGKDTEKLTIYAGDVTWEGDEYWPTERLVLGMSIKDSLVFTQIDSTTGDSVEYVVKGDLNMGMIDLMAGIPYPVQDPYELIWGEWEDSLFVETIYIEFMSTQMGRFIDHYWDGWYDPPYEWTDSSDFVWSSTDDVVTITEEVEEWDDDISDYVYFTDTYAMDYKVEDEVLTISDSWDFCDEGWEWMEFDDPLSPYACGDSIKAVLPLFGLNDVESLIITENIVLDYDGATGTEETALEPSTLPLLSQMDGMYMQYLDISENRLYGGGETYISGKYREYLRMVDISDPSDPKELDYNHTDENFLQGDYFANLFVKDNVAITTSNYGPLFFDVSEDKFNRLTAISSSVTSTKCCYDDGADLYGNKLYISTELTMGNGFRIIDVTNPKSPSHVSDVTMTDLRPDDGTDPWIVDLVANDKYVVLLDKYGGAGTEDMVDNSAVRIFSTTSPYTEVAKFDVGYSYQLVLEGNYIYLIDYGLLKIYDISDITNIKTVSKLGYDYHAAEYICHGGDCNSYWNYSTGDMRLHGNYLYSNEGFEYGLDIFDVSDPTKPFRVGSIPEKKHDPWVWNPDTEEWDYIETYFDFYAWDMSFSSGNMYLGFGEWGSAKGALHVYSTNFAPAPVELMFPTSGAEVEITEENAWEESLVFAWKPSIDREGSTVNYTVFFDKGLDPLYWHIFDACEDAENTCTIPLHRMKNYLHIEGLSSVSGVWDVLASDGVSNTYSSNGPFKLTIDASSVSTADEASLPMDFALHSNFPNPFNPTTTIKYDLPENASVSLMIYDIMGREIRHLVNDTQKAGFKAIMWDGTNNYGHQVGTGMYLYQIKAGSFVQTRKMILMK